MKLLNSLYLINCAAGIAFMLLSAHMYLTNIVHAQFIMGTGLLLSVGNLSYLGKIFKINISLKIDYIAAIIGSILVISDVINTLRYYK